MLSLSDTLRVFVARFASMTWSIASKSMVWTTWPCPIVKVLATGVKFLESPGYYTAINYAFTLYTTFIINCFYCVIAHFGLVKHKFLNYTMLHVHLWFLNHTWIKAMQMSAHQWVTSTARTALVMWYIHCKLTHAKCC